MFLPSDEEGCGWYTAKSTREDEMFYDLLSKFMSTAAAPWWMLAVFVVAMLLNWAHQRGYSKKTMEGLEKGQKEQAKSIGKLEDKIDSARGELVSKIDKVDSKVDRVDAKVDRVNENLTKRQDRIQDNVPGVVYGMDRKKRQESEQEPRRRQQGRDR